MDMNASTDKEMVKCPACGSVSLQKKGEKRKCVCGHGG